MTNRWSKRVRILLRRALQAATWGPRGNCLWVRGAPPLASQRVCLFACHSTGRPLSKHTRHLLEKWRLHGFKVILIVAADHPTRFISVARSVDYSNVDGIAVRPNVGYDFGSWAAAIRSLPDVRNASLLALANDSLYGPLNGFAELIARVDSSCADIVGVTDSHEIQHHLQSYLVFHKPASLTGDAFEKFWQSVRWHGRESTIRRLELPMLDRLKESDVKVEVLFPADFTRLGNPTLVHWKELLEAGFPFVKVQLLRDNPRQSDITGWDQEMLNRGYDPRLVQDHLEEAFGRCARSACTSTQMSLGTSTEPLLPTLPG